MENTTPEQDLKITVDDVEYNVSDLSPQAVYCVEQLQIIRKESDEAKKLLDRLEMSSVGFVDLLKKELQKQGE